MSIEYVIAEKSDEQELRRILKENPMSGDIELAFSREPNYFIAADVEGKNTKVLTARDNGRIIGFGSMSVKNVFLNGEKAEVGYLSGLRMEKDYRGGVILARGFSIFKRMHSENKVRFYLTTIAEDNTYVKKILGSNRPGMAIYNPRGVYLTRAVNIYNKKPETHKFNIIRGNDKNIEIIMECINRNGSKRQYYPCVSKDDVITGHGNVRGLNVSDFYAAEKDGRIIGTCARWDQSLFKQNIITGYSGKMSVIKPFYNMFAGLFNFNPLPEKGKELNSFYLSFISADNDDPEILESIIRRIYNDSVGSKYHYFLAGFFRGDPMERSLNGYISVTYKTRLYLVCWDDGMEAVAGVDGRQPYLEAATL